MSCRVLKYSMLKNVLISAFVLSLGACDFVFGSNWSSSEIRATVIDAQTSKPIAGAIVVANWQLSSPYEGYPSGQLALIEVTTNEKGDFHIPAWGPKRAQGALIVRGDQPIVRVFRRGYLPLVVNNIPPGGGQNIFRADRYIHPWINGQTLKLVPFHGSLSEYPTQLSSLQWSMEFAFSGSDCEWKQVPLMLIELDRVKSELLEIGIPTNLRNVNNILGPEKCGTGSNFFRSYRK